MYFITIYSKNKLRTQTICYDELDLTEISSTLPLHGKTTALSVEKTSQITIATISFSF